MAASKLVNGDKLIAKHSLSGNRLRNHTITGKQVNLKKLGQVPLAAHAVTPGTATSAATAGNANTVGGLPPSAFFPASKVRTFNVKLAFGQTQTLFTAGTLTFYAKCVKNGTAPNGPTGQDYSGLFVSTSSNGAIFNGGSDGGFAGANAGDFLNTNTAEASRAIAYVSAATGTKYGTIEDNGSGYGMEAVDPNGLVVIIPDGVTGAVNLFGSDCLLAGVAVLP